MADFPALPLWTDALLGDTSHLDDCRFGLYLRILILMWRTPGCRIPRDYDWITNKLPGRSLESLQAIVGEFCQTDGNWITQKRLTREFNFVSARSQKQSDRANSRWKKEKAPSRGNARRGNAPTPTPTPTSPQPPKGGLAHANGKAPTPPTTRWHAALGLDVEAIGKGVDLLQGCTNGKPFVIETTTPEFQAWSDHLRKTTGKAPPGTTGYWFFAARWPPSPAGVDQSEGAIGPEKKSAAGDPSEARQSATAKSDKDADQ